MYVKRLDGHEGMLRRQCTSNYKIDPIRRRLRVLMKEHGVKRVRQQQGISFDEAVKRMRVSDVQYIENAYPLVDLRMDRQACKRWLSEHGYPIPGKSACIGCPYHDRATWREMRANRPADFANACDFEDGLREKGGSAIGDAFLTRAFIPLRDVDLSSAEDRGQLSFGDGFGDECFGMCGV